MTKAIHEAKVNLSWVNQNPEYTKALQDFVAAILEPGEERRPNHFLTYIQGILPHVQYFGAINSLTQTLVKLTAPGVPDIYQGLEMFDFSLVDPDNRRPVNFEVRRRALQALKGSAEGGFHREICRDVLANWWDGRVKLWTVAQTLALRRDYRDLFMEGDYTPLWAAGDYRRALDCICPQLPGKTCAGGGASAELHADERHAAAADRSGVGTRVY